MNYNAQYVHVNLIARDWRRLAAFYTDVFGCAIVPPERHLSGEWLERLAGIPGARIDGAHLSLPGCGTTLEVFEYSPAFSEESSAAIHRPGFGHIAFRVDDVRAVVQKIVECGGGLLGEIVEQKIEGVGMLTVAYAKDPEGNFLEIQNIH